MTKTELGSLSPQRPRLVREFAESADYIMEPCWEGTRALAVLGPEPAFVGYEGRRVDGPRELLQAIGAVADCERAVIDGVIVHRFAEEAELEAAGEGDAFLRPALTREVYVAVDLLEVDDISLLEAPLLERKRHLAGVLAPSANVRISPYVGKGMRAWRETLEGQGFRRFLVKRVNSRYRPGVTTNDWLQIEKL